MTAIIVSAGQEPHAMNPRIFALIWGILFLMIAATGFIPGLLQPPPPGHPELAVETLYGDALGLFPVNIIHSGLTFSTASGA